METLSPERAKAALKLRRRKKRKKLEGSFKSFIEYIFPLIEGVDFIFKEHHERIIEVLEAVVRGEKDRVIINIPPGYGKTEIVVVLFSAWCYAIQPKTRNLHLSYSDALVNANSVKIKNIINLQEFQELWPTEWDRSQGGKEHWKTYQGGEFRAVSTSGAMTGFRAGRMQDGFYGAILFDDPLKPEDAQSSIKRAAKNALVTSTIKSRLMKAETPIVLIMQRLHDDDTTGYLLEGNSGDDWERVNIPAILDTGTENERALWPEKENLEYLRSFQAASPLVFSGQYQGEPAPDDGTIFKRDNFNWYEPQDLPSGTDFGAADFASADEKTADFTELGVFRVTPDRKIYIHDWWSGQAQTKEWVTQMLLLSKIWGINKWAGETGPIRRSVEPFMVDMMVEKGVFFSREWFNHSEATKADNAQGFAALVDAGRVYLPKHTVWAAELLEQLIRFPAAKNDDKVDTCSLFAKMINKVWSIEQTTPTESQPQGLTLDELVAANRRANRNKRRRL